MDFGNQRFAGDRSQHRSRPDRSVTEQAAAKLHIADADLAAGVDHDHRSTAFDQRVRKHQAAVTAPGLDDDRAGFVLQIAAGRGADGHPARAKVEHHLRSSEAIDPKQAVRPNVVRFQCGRADNRKFPRANMECGDIDRRGVARTGHALHPGAYSSGEAKMLGELARDDRPFGAGIDEEAIGAVIADVHCDGHPIG